MTANTKTKEKNSLKNLIKRKTACILWAKRVRKLEAKFNACNSLLC